MLKIMAQRVFGKWAIQIVQQDRRGDDFSPTTYNEFIASNGFRLKSDGIMRLSHETLHVGGESPEDFEDQILILPDDDWFDRMKVAVQEYNDMITAYEARQAARAEIPDGTIEIIPPE